MEDVPQEWKDNAALLATRQLERAAACMSLAQLLVFRGVMAELTYWIAVVADLPNGVEQAIKCLNENKQWMDTFVAHQMEVRQSCQSTEP